MDENNTNTQTTSKTLINTADVVAPTSLIDHADAVATRMEAANKKAEELIERQEKIAARLLLSGRTEAGTVLKSSEELEKEQIEKEIKERLNRL